MTDQENEQTPPQNIGEGLQNHEESGIRKLEGQLTAIQGQLAMFALRSEVQETAKQTRDYVDQRTNAIEAQFTKLINQMNQTLQSINDTITGLNRTVGGLNTAVVGLDGQLKHFDAIVNQLTQRQEAQSRAQDQIRSEMREVRDDIDKAQVDISTHSSLLTAQGQMMRDFQGVVYGDGTRESVFGLLREMKAAQSELSAKVDEVVRWKDAVVTNMLKGVGTRLAEAWGWPPVRAAAAGAALSGLVALAAEVAKLL